MFNKSTVSLTTSIVKTQHKNFGANIKSLKARIKSVSSIAKITKAMKLVSSSKMRMDLQRLEQGKFYGHETINKIFKSDIYMQRRMQNIQVRKTLYVPFTSDRGLCGGINSATVREIKNIIKNEGPENSGLYVIGDKGITGLTRAYGSLITRGVHELNVPINYTTASSVANDIIHKSEGYDKIMLVYNCYKSAISSIITKTELYSRDKFLDYFGVGKAYFMKNPDKLTCNPALYDLYISSNFYFALLHNLASEQSARMSAMENASKNAKEIVEKLLLEYNKARQAKITMELCEIISGASAV
jgi:F-type H+-transporting ATPase subunit gamma